jgi:uracil-DNA glycosylase
MDALDRYVEEIRRSKGEGVPIPAFSRHDGRTEAQVLFLLRDPGASGASESGEIDRGNSRSAARNFRIANDAAGLDRKLTISWNAVPWPVGDRKFTAELDRVRSEGWLDKLLKLLPRLRVVVLLGEDAHELTPDLYTTRPDLHVLHGPHPSWRGVGTPQRREWLEDTVRKAKHLVAAE